MRIPSEQFLSLRAIGAPAVVVSLAIQGIFRGFKDTKTPVLCLGKFSLPSEIYTIYIYIYIRVIGLH
jgi:Na+-driven multidrug efflux pump